MIIQNGNNEGNLEFVKEKLQNYWDYNWKNKAKQEVSYCYSDEEENTEVSSKSKKKKDIALTITNGKKTPFLSINCDHCKKPGHNQAKCWLKHPELHPSEPHTKMYQEEMRTCFLCNKQGHIATNCPNKKQDVEEPKNTEESLNSLFIGTVTLEREGMYKSCEDCSDNFYAQNAQKAEFSLHAIFLSCQPMKIVPMQDFFLMRTFSAIRAAGKQVTWWT